MGSWLANGRVQARQATTTMWYATETKTARQIQGVKLAVSWNDWPYVASFTHFDITL